MQTICFPSSILLFTLCSHTAILPKSISRSCDLPATTCKLSNFDRFQSSFSFDSRTDLFSIYSQNAYFEAWNSILSGFTIHAFSKSQSNRLLPRHTTIGYSDLDLAAATRMFRFSIYMHAESYKKLTFSSAQNSAKFLLSSTTRLCRPNRCPRLLSSPLSFSGPACSLEIHFNYLCSS